MSKLPITIAFPSLKIVVFKANSADPDEMPHYAAFHLGIPCLPRTHVGVTSIERVKGRLCA